MREHDIIINARQNIERNVIYMMPTIQDTIENLNAWNRKKDLLQNISFGYELPETYYLTEEDEMDQEVKSIRELIREYREEHRPVFDQPRKPTVDEKITAMQKEFDGHFMDMDECNKFIRENIPTLNHKRRVSKKMIYDDVTTIGCLRAYYFRFLQYEKFRGGILHKYLHKIDGNVDELEYLSYAIYKHKDFGESDKHNRLFVISCRDTTKSWHINPQQILGLTFFASKKLTLMDPTKTKIIEPIMTDVNDGTLNAYFIGREDLEYMFMIRPGVEMVFVHEENEMAFPFYFAARGDGFLHFTESITYDGDGCYRIPIIMKY